MVRQIIVIEKKTEMPCPKCAVRKMHDTYSIMSSQGKKKKNAFITGKSLNPKKSQDKQIKKQRKIVKKKS